MHLNIPTQNHIGPSFLSLLEVGGSVDLFHWNSVSMFSFIIYKAVGLFRRKTSFLKVIFSMKSNKLETFRPLVEMSAQNMSGAETRL